MSALPSLAQINAARARNPDPAPTDGDMLAWLEGEILAGAELALNGAQISFDKSWTEEGLYCHGSALDYEGSSAGPTEVVVPSLVVERWTNGKAIREAFPSLRAALRELMK